MSGDERPLLSIDRREFRHTLGHFVTGVTVIASEMDGGIRAMTANSFTSLSLDPPLVLFCVGKGTRTGERIQSTPGFSVNILRHDQQDLSAYFAGTWTEPEPPPFSFVSWVGAAPRLERCAAAIACTVESIYEGGDHWIVVGRVLDLYLTDEAHEPLVFFGGRYRTLKGDL
jgi:flavin reductase (DIM6/NTAB) family NADH-FMN oxidoreductase RutF